VGVVYGKKNLTFTVFFKKIASKSFRMDALPVGKRGLVGKPLVEIKSLDIALKVMTTLDATQNEAGKPAKPKTKEEEYHQESILGKES
jgi:hypothetical protein